VQVCSRTFTLATCSSGIASAEALVFGAPGSGVPGAPGVVPGRGAVLDEPASSLPVTSTRLLTFSLSFAFVLLEPLAPDVDGVPVDGEPGVAPGVAPAVGAPDRSWTLVSTKSDEAPAGAVPPDPLAEARQPLTVTVCPIMFFRLSCLGVSGAGRVVCGVVGGVCGGWGDGVCAITAPANVTLNASAAAFRNAFLFISSPCFKV
jgi:hypothetical protein